jgi:hypothetical protein
VNRRQRRNPLSLRMAAAFAALLLLAALSAPRLTAQTTDDHGSFRILLHGQPIGTESWAVRTSSDGTSAQSQIQYQGATGSVQQSATLRLGPDLSLIHYQWRQDKARVDIEAEQDHLSAHYRDDKGHVKEYAFYMPPTTAILDDNFYFLWQLLADRYDRAKGGVQTFRVFVPHTGDPGTVRIEAQPSHAPGVTLLQAQTDQTTVEISMKGSQLERLEMPSAGLTVVRQ